MRRVLLLVAAALSAAPAPARAPAPANPRVCQPLPVVKVVPGLAANSSYATSVTTEPPVRFRGNPRVPLIFYFGREHIDRLCGVPPCHYVFRGCVRGRKVVLLNPFETSDADVARFLRHEIAHINGWPPTHGD